MLQMVLNWPENLEPIFASVQRRYKKEGGEKKLLSCKEFNFKSSSIPVFSVSLFRGNLFASLWFGNTQLMIKSIGTHLVYGVSGVLVLTQPTCRIDNTFSGKRKDSVTCLGHD